MSSTVSPGCGASTWEVKMEGRFWRKPMSPSSSALRGGES